MEQVNIHACIYIYIYEVYGYFYTTFTGVLQLVLGPRVADCMLY